jgi:hypothetical protein
LIFSSFPLFSLPDNSFSMFPATDLKIGGWISRLMVFGRVFEWALIGRLELKSLTFSDGKLIK